MNHFYCILGVPFVPSDINIHFLNGNKDVLIVWKSKSTELQPVNGFAVIVESTTTTRDTPTIARRQTVTGQTTREEYKTPWSNFLLEGLDRKQMHTVQVCAENDLGRSCADPLSLEFPQPATLPTPQGISDSEKTGLPLEYLIPIIVLPILLVILCCLLLVGIIICVCMRHRSKHYYPAKQGTLSFIVCNPLCS